MPVGAGPGTAGLESQGIPERSPATRHGSLSVGVGGALTCVLQSLPDDLRVWPGQRENENEVSKRKASVLHYSWTT